MTNKRHPASDPAAAGRAPIAPSLDPETGAPPAPMVPEDAAAWAAEIEALKDRHLRLAAEYDNFRKRTAKERTEAWTRAQADLIARIADVLDDLSRFAQIDPLDVDTQTLHEGIDLVERKLWKELEAAGVTRIDVVGAPFDPNVHEAVTMQPAPSPEQDHTVGQVVQPGYKMRDVLLRPARVVVLTWPGK